ncbi:MAG: sugar transporter permease [Rhodoferax sp.]|nr:sugar transporter permease [Rhodoferax sp.]
MNPHATPSPSPGALIRSLRAHRHLVATLVAREVVGRYRGSMLGLFWSFFNPVLMLAVYTVIFSTVFKARWTPGSESKTEFALVLFSGLMMFNFFSECVNRAPTVILANANYVKKVVFPLEVLPVVMLGSAGFHLLVSLLVWLIFYCAVMGLPHWTLLQLPLAILPLVLLTLGATWLLAALGVYLRDVAQVVGVATAVLMFLSPIFYPITALPAGFRALVELSPLSFAVEQSRNVMIWGTGIDWPRWSLHTVQAMLVAWVGFACFQKVRRGFADVL